MLRCISIGLDVELVKRTQLNNRPSPVLLVAVDFFRQSSKATRRAAGARRVSNSGVPHVHTALTQALAKRSRQLFGGASVSPTLQCAAPAASWTWRRVEPQQAHAAAEHWETGLRTASDSVDATVYLFHSASSVTLLGSTY